MRLASVSVLFYFHALRQRLGELWSYTVLLRPGGMQLEHCESCNMYRLCSKHARALPSPVVSCLPTERMRVHVCVHLCNVNSTASIMALVLWCSCSPTTITLASFFFHPSPSSAQTSRPLNHLLGFNIIFVCWKLDQDAALKLFLLAEIVLVGLPLPVSAHTLMPLLSWKH